MRIRKRKVPFPLSSLSPVPITVSDPLINLNRPPPVVVQLSHYYDPSQNDAVNPLENPSQEQRPQATHVTTTPPQPSDRPINHHLSPIGTTDGWDHKDKIDKKKKKEEDNHLELLFKEGEEEEKGNDISKGSISGAEAVSGFQFPEVRKWCEGEKAFPLKKRRGSFLLDHKDETTLVMEDQKDKKIMNTKTIKTKTNNKKLPSSTSSRKNDNVVEDGIHNHQHYDQDGAHYHHQQLGNNINGGNGGGGGGGKNNKKVKGGALVEGSRCSRVNGRGWRCCQQTLVGYSLCEHHLGKGRLRSMTSVRSRSLAKSTKATATTGRLLADSLSSSSSVVALYEEKVRKPQQKPHVKERGSIVNIEVDDDEDDDNDDDDDDDDDYGDHDYEKKKPLVITKKRMKLGMVKARSISSLLGQTNSTTGAISMADSK